MATIPQPTLFSWKEIENLGDLSRLKLLLGHLPDETLMQKLEQIRGKKGRNDYPIRALWNSLLAGIVFQHSSIESLRRELDRNAQLCWICGFDLARGDKTVPGSYVYSRFLNLLLRYEEDVLAIFEQLVHRVGEELPDFGESVAIDGKALSSVARKRGANAEAHKLVKHLNDRHPLLWESCEHFVADRGYDDGKLHKRLWDEHGIKPVIDIRNLWKAPEGMDATRAVRTLEAVAYDFRGHVYGYNHHGQRHKMAFKGFEKDRQTLKYVCPSGHYGLNCCGRSQCAINNSVRIPIEEDRRVFGPIARDSYKWKRLYRRRTASERVYSRLDTSFGFESHTIRGAKKMRVRVALGYMSMLAMALGRIKENQAEKMRSLVKAA